VAYDPEHRLVLAVVFGQHQEQNVQKLMQQVKAQMQGRIPTLISTDGYSGYSQVFRRVYGQVLKAVHKRGQPNPGGPKRQVPAELTHAVVQKRMEKGQVVEVKRELAIGTEQNLQTALEQSAVSRTVNTSFLERQNATDRHFNSRKHRRSYCFSKDWQVHQAAGYFSLYSYNFCWCVRTLRCKGPDGRYQARTPAMAAGLTDHVWSLEQWLRYPVIANSS
jgi:IS1 family transposase